MLSFNFVGAKEYYAEENVCERRSMAVESSSESDSEGPRVMDEGEEDDYEDGPDIPIPEQEEGGVAAEDEFVMLQFPPPNPAIEFDESGHKFRFKAELIPSTIPSIPPKIMSAMATLTEATARQKAAIAFHPCMPMPVHASPLISLFANKMVQPKGAACVQVQQRPYKEKFVSFMFTCYQLQQLKLATLNGFIQFHPSFNEVKLRKAELEYQHQLKQMGAHQDKCLDALYAKAISPEGIADKRQIMIEFISLLEIYSLQYIHLLEYFIHTCLIAPHRSIPLEACLTPGNIPTLLNCVEAQREAVMRDVVVFFEHKLNYREAQERQNQASAQQNTDAPTGARLQVDAIMPAVKSGQAEVYGGYMPLSTLYEYFCFLDCDGILQQKPSE